jgi:hypothetical protein
MTMPVRSQRVINPVSNPRLFEGLVNALSTILASRKGDQGRWEVATGALISTRPVLSLRSPSGEHKMRTITFTQIAIHPIRLPIDVFRRKARRLAVRLVQYIRFYADCYSAAVQYEDLAKLSAAELERCGIAPAICIATYRCAPEMAPVPNSTRIRGVPCSNELERINASGICL